MTGIRNVAVRMLAFAAIGVGIVLVAVAIGMIGSFKAVAPGDVCVVQEGGPFDGRDIAAVRQPSGGVKFIGLFNSQHCFPATQRNYVISRAAVRRENYGTSAYFEAATSDAVQVRIEGQALFEFNADPAAVKLFYAKFGVREFGGRRPYDGSEGWTSFLAVQFKPVLDNALREAIGEYRCVDLNNTCAYVQDAGVAATGSVGAIRDITQNLSKVQNRIGATLERDLESTLGGPFFKNVRFRVVQVKFDPKVQASITAATAARANVVTARLEARARVESAKGDRRVAAQQAQAIRSKRRAYRENPAQARIDAIRALPQGLQALGGDVNATIGRAP